MTIEEEAARVGLTLVRTRLPEAVPALVVGAHLLARDDATDEEVLVAAAGEVLRREGPPFSSADAQTQARKFQHVPS